jgi:hypothetical protein
MFFVLLSRLVDHSIGWLVTIWLGDFLTFKYRTRPVFACSSYIFVPSNHHKGLHSDHLKTGLFGIKMVILQTLFVSGFQMVFYHPISGPVFKWFASLNCFIWRQIKMFFFCIKWSSLADHSKTWHKCPVFEWFNHTKPGPDFFLLKKNVLWLFSCLVFEWSGISISSSSWNRPVQYQTSLVFRWSRYIKYVQSQHPNTWHSNTRTIRSLDKFVPHFKWQPPFSFCSGFQMLILA